MYKVLPYRYYTWAGCSLCQGFQTKFFGLGPEVPASDCLSVVVGLYGPL